MIIDALLLKLPEDETGTHLKRLPWLRSLIALTSPRGLHGESRLSPPSLLKQQVGAECAARTGSPPGIGDVAPSTRHASTLRARARPDLGVCEFYAHFPGVSRSFKIVVGST